MVNVKERVLLIAEAKGISKTEFFKGVGLSYANFKGGQKNTALSSDAMVAILTHHPDINPAWLLMGEGSMLRGAEPGLVEPEASAICSERLGVYKQLVAALEKTVNAQEKTIASLEGQVAMLQQK